MSIRKRPPPSQERQRARIEFFKKPGAPIGPIVTPAPDSLEEIYWGIMALVEPFKAGGSKSTDAFLELERYVWREFSCDACAEDMLVGDFTVKRLREYRDILRLRGRFVASESERMVAASNLSRAIPLKVAKAAANDDLRKLLATNEISASAFYKRIIPPLFIICIGKERTKQRWRINGIKWLEDENEKKAWFRPHFLPLHLYREWLFDKVQAEFTERIREEVGKFNSKELRMPDESTLEYVGGKTKSSDFIMTEQERRAGTIDRAHTLSHTAMAGYSHIHEPDIFEETSEAGESLDELYKWVEDCAVKLRVEASALLLEISLGFTPANRRYWTKFIEVFRENPSLLIEEQRQLARKGSGLSPENERFIWKKIRDQFREKASDTALHLRGAGHALLRPDGSTLMVPRWVIGALRHEHLLHDGNPPRLRSGIYLYLGEPTTRTACRLLYTLRADLSGPEIVHCHCGTC